MESHFFYIQHYFIYIIFYYSNGNYLNQHVVPQKKFSTFSPVVFSSSPVINQEKRLPVAPAPLQEADGTHPVIQSSQVHGADPRSGRCLSPYRLSAEALSERRRLGFAPPPPPPPPHRAPGLMSLCLFFGTQSRTNHRLDCQYKGCVWAAGSGCYWGIPATYVSLYSCGLPMPFVILWLWCRHTTCRWVKRGFFSAFVLFVAPGGADER